MAVLRISRLPFFALKAPSNEEASGFILRLINDWLWWWHLECASPKYVTSYINT
jgi:hypothetical protein